MLMWTSGNKELKATHREVHAQNRKISVGALVCFGCFSTTRGVRCRAVLWLLLLLFVCVFEVVLQLWGRIKDCNKCL